jgi:hypothetical protein
MKRNILIIGGYGEVGSRISKKVNTQKNNLFIAGRSMNKSIEFIRREKLDAQAVKLDVERMESFDFTNFQLILNCIEKCNEKLLQLCINYKIDYMDMSPSADILRMFSGYKQQIKNAGIHLICGIGVASLSYLMLEHATEEFDELVYVDSFLTLGIRESHGRDAVKWMVDNLNKEIVIGDKSEKGVESSISIKLPSNKKHTFYKVDLIDDFINKECFPNIKSNSWFSTDVNPINHYLIFLRKIGVLNLLKYQRVRRLFCMIFQWFLGVAHRIKLGDNQYIVALIAEGMQEGNKQSTMYYADGRENAELTSQMAADIVNDYEQYCNQNQSIYGVKYLKIETYIKRNFIKYKVFPNYKESSCSCL